MKKILLLLLVITGCVRVRPQERESLAHPAMQARPWPELARDRAHVEDVREGTGGGDGAAGGGCGCN